METLTWLSHFEVRTAHQRMEEVCTHSKIFPGLRKMVINLSVNQRPWFSGKVLHCSRGLPFIVLATGKPFSWLVACLTWKGNAILFCSKSEIRPIVFSMYLPK